MYDCLKIAVTGEVDSGKSTLIGRFLYDTGSLSEGVIEEIEKTSQKLGRDLEFAYLLDSLEEERRNQLTIDTTEAFCKPKKGRQFIFIDVPGHKELLKNMLCGTSYADIAILVVDAQKSMEEQTRRHAFILEFLGIKKIILVLNKMDSVHFNESAFNKARCDIAKFFNKFGPRLEHFIPISAKEGEGLLRKSRKMGWYKGLPLAGALNACKKEERGRNLRFPVQDIYTINNEKIAVGKIISGKIKRGEEVTVLPLGKKYKVKEIKIFNKDKPMAEAPESIGLILDKMEGLGRGQVVCKGSLPQIKTEVLTKIFCVRPLNTGEGLKLRCITQESNAWLRQIKRIWDSASLEPSPKESVLEETNIAEAVISVEGPLAVESFGGLNSLGRFVIKDSRDICAVGIIL